MYGMNVSPQHDNFQVDECGLFVSPMYPTLGASPDGIISCDCCGIGTLEIKCPYCSRDFTPETATEYEMLTFLEHDEDRLKLKESHAYFYQVQAQLHICEVQYGDFVVWTPQGIHVERILPQHDFFQQKVDIIEEFYKQGVLPELLGKWYTKVPIMPAAPSSNSSVDESGPTNVELWCYCQQPESDREMVGCDYPDCSIQWFHLDCLDLHFSKIPKGNWYCPDCRKKFSGKHPRCANKKGTD